MKRLLALLVFTLWFCGVQAQGTFTFSNRVLSAGLDQPVFDVGGADPLDRPGFVAAILLNGVQLGAPAPFHMEAGSGYWNPGADSSRVVPGKFSGDIVSGFTVQVWDSSKGATYHASKAAGGDNGESVAFSITLGGPKAAPLASPDPPGVMVNFKAFAIGYLGQTPHSSPEPAVMTLGALGAAVMFGRWRCLRPKTVSGQIARDL